MYVASYVTYISPFQSTKVNVQRDESAEKKGTSFSLEQKKQSTNTLQTEKYTPKETYLPHYNFLRQQQPNKELDAFEKMKNYQDAKVAYKENSQMYSLARKPKSVIGGPKIDLQIPKEAQEAKKSISKQEMINTYIENENYYRITAA